MDTYKIKYIGKLKIEELNPGYRISISLGCDYLPKILYIPLEEDKMIAILKRELHDMMGVQYGELNLRNPYLCDTPDTSCTCRKKI